MSASDRNIPAKTDDGVGVGAFVRRAARQEQFLTVVDRDEAMARFHRHVHAKPRGAVRVSLPHALGRVLAQDVVAAVDVPAFDRSSVDGFAVRAADTLGASPDRPVRLRLNDEVLAAGHAPTLSVAEGTATVIATGGMAPRGADAVVMVERTEFVEDEAGCWITLEGPASPGQFVASAGSDIGMGETVLRRGQRLTAREVGILAAVGVPEVAVWARPRVAILSTGDEIIAPGDAPRPAGVYDSNGAVLAAAVEELGGEPVPLGIAPDDEAILSERVAEGLKADMLLLSGGTSKGAGDLNFRIISRLTNPGVVAHGVALKPGKPLCLAVTDGKPVVVLPGFPTSAMFTFHEFVAPVIQAMAGRMIPESRSVEAELPVALPSERGRTEYVMVSLVEKRDEHGEKRLSAYPITKGSGAVTAFGLADGFIAVPAQVESVPKGTPVDVRLIGRDLEPADLTIIGSHCVGLDRLVGGLIERGHRVKLLSVGSTGGLMAARRGECDVAPVHLLDPNHDRYNVDFVQPGMTLIPGYRRRQGVVFRPDDGRFAGHADGAAAMAAAAADPERVMTNRTAGSGTRVLIDRLLGEARPPGYWHQSRSHNAVAAAVAQGRADWGVTIEAVAGLYGLGFLPLRDESYDFLIPAGRMDRPAVTAFIERLRSAEFAGQLAALGFGSGD